jgi:dienelactone hydrolase
MVTLLALLVAAASPAPACTDARAFVGTICAPATHGKHPAIVVLGGSEGGNSMAFAAAQFAQHGYVAASVAYFKAPGLPQILENVPVETVGKALDEIAKRPDVDASRIAITGDSKGGELSLLAASVYPQIHAVVAVVPSPFAWEGIPNGPAAVGSSWTVNGKPVPYVHYGAVMGQVNMVAFTQHQPLDLRKGYSASMQQNAQQIPAAMFHLENIRGPVLMLGADDDQIWDSDAQSHLGLQYLQDHHHPYKDEYLHYAGAGHLFMYSSRERPLTEVPMGPTTLLLGGTLQANLRAQEQAWPKVYEFLAAALQAGADAPGK